MHRGVIIISYGVEKSGSTLAFEMTKAIVELNGHPQARLADGLVNEGPAINEVGPWTDERLSQLVEATRGTKIVVRTHHAPRRLSSSHVLEYIDAGEVRIQVVFRDPRDMVVSMIDDGVRARALHERRHSDIRTVDDAIPLLGRRLRALRQWGWFPSLRLPYEVFAFDRARGPQLIAEYLAMTADPGAVWGRLEGRHTRRNVGRPHRYRTELWPGEITRIERAFPLYLELVQGTPATGWFALESR